MRALSSSNGGVELVRWIGGARATLPIGCVVQDVDRPRSDRATTRAALVSTSRFVLARLSFESDDRTGDARSIATPIGRAEKRLDLVQHHQLRRFAQQL